MLRATDKGGKVPLCLSSTAPFPFQRCFFLLLLLLFFLRLGISSWPCFSGFPPFFSLPGATESKRMEGGGHRTLHVKSGFFSLREGKGGSSTAQGGHIQGKEGGGGGGGAKVRGAC